MDVFVVHTLHDQRLVFEHVGTESVVGTLRREVLGQSDQIRFLVVVSGYHACGREFSWRLSPD